MMIEGFFIWMAGVAFGLSLALAIMQKQRNDALLKASVDMAKRLDREMDAVANFHALMLRRLVSLEAQLKEHLPDYDKR